MANGVHGRVEAMQSRRLEPPLNLAASEPEPGKLCTGDDAILHGCEISEVTIGVPRRSKRTK